MGVNFNYLDDNPLFKQRLKLYKSVDGNITFNDQSNEYLYLFNKNLDVIDSILELQKRKRSKNRTFEFLLNGIIVEYKKIVELASKLVIKLGLPNNEISYSRVISRLIHEGYLSNNGVFVKTDNKDNLLDIPGYFGIDVINGYGCCRNVSGIHKDICDFLNIDNTTLYCYSDKNGFSIIDAFEKCINHVVNVIKYQDRYYIHDILAERFCFFKDIFTIKNYFNIDGVLCYKPSGDMLFNLVSYDDMISNMCKLDCDRVKPHLGNEDLKDIIDRTDGIFDNSKDELIEFKDSIDPLVKKIVMR